MLERERLKQSYESLKESMANEAEQQKVRHDDALERSAAKQPIQQVEMRNDESISVNIKTTISPTKKKIVGGSVGKRKKSASSSLKKPLVRQPDKQGAERFKDPKFLQSLSEVELQIKAV